MRPDHSRAAQGTTSTEVKSHAWAACSPGVWWALRSPVEKHGGRACGSNSWPACRRPSAVRVRTQVKEPGMSISTPDRLPCQKVVVLVASDDPARNLSDLAYAAFS